MKPNAISVEFILLLVSGTNAVFALILISAKNVNKLQDIIILSSKLDLFAKLLWKLIYNFLKNKQKNKICLMLNLIKSNTITYKKNSDWLLAIYKACWDNNKRKCTNNLRRFRNLSFLRSFLRNIWIGCKDVKILFQDM